MGLFAGIRRRLSGDTWPKTDFYDLAKRAPRVPPAELAVAEAALADGGPIAERLLRQLRQGGTKTAGRWGRVSVWRLIAEEGPYELRVSTRDAIRDVPREGWSSDWIPVSEAPSGRALELRIVVSQAGIAELAGRTLDGQPWPKAWEVRTEVLDAIRARAPWLRLPTPADIGASRAHAAAVIEQWLGEAGALRGRRGVVSVESPAAAAAVATFEAAQGVQLPAAYRELLELADGIEVGRRVILGTRDAYRLDIPGPDRLVIAPPDETGALVLAPSGEVLWVDIDDPTSDGRRLASDLREWLRKELSRRRAPGTSARGRFTGLSPAPPPDSQVGS